MPTPPGAPRRHRTRGRSPRGASSDSAGQVARCHASPAALQGWSCHSRGRPAAPHTADTSTSPPRGTNLLAALVFSGARPFFGRGSPTLGAPARGPRARRHGSWHARCGAQVLRRPRPFSRGSSELPSDSTPATRRTAQAEDTQPRSSVLVLMTVSMSFASSTQVHMQTKVHKGHKGHTRTKRVGKLRGVATPTPLPDPSAWRVGHILRCSMSLCSQVVGSTGVGFARAAAPESGTPGAGVQLRPSSRPVSKRNFIFWTWTFAHFGQIKGRSH